MENLKRIYVPGTFDCLHRGHIHLFKTAKGLGTVIASLNTDEFVERYKRKPLMPLLDRLSILLELKCVDEVVVNWGDEDSRQAILDSGATHILHGDDWSGNSLLEQMGLTQEWLDENEIEMLYIPYTRGISTTQLLNEYVN